MVDISVRFAGMELKNPVMPAAGPPVKDARSARLARDGGAGVLVTKTISVKAAAVPRPNMAEVRGGLLNAELWSETSPEKWFAEEYPAIAELGLPVIAGLGYSAEEIRELAPEVEPYADALELSTHYLGNDPTPVIESIQAAREAVGIPVFVKLSPQVDIVRFAAAAEEAGADGIVLINSLGPTLEIDPATGKPLLGSQDGYGWLSGQAIFPLALRCVYQAAGKVNIPVIGVGGISRGIDAIKMIMAGAEAVQVCTGAIVAGAGIYARINKEIEEFMLEYGYKSLDEIRGLAQTNRQIEANFVDFRFVVDPEKCTACGRCVTSCVYQAIEPAGSGRDAVVIRQERCASCGLCLTRCRPGAISKIRQG
ncbi:MAG: 4Fe-4S binding protein [Halanaerobium sp.]|nr:4Fe-4S binding protein [Halanaerobium sp.]